jgi:hypothetical protein
MLQATSKLFHMREQSNKKGLKQLKRCIKQNLKTNLECKITLEIGTCSWLEPKGSLKVEELTKNASNRSKDSL